MRFFVGVVLLSVLAGCFHAPAEIPSPPARGTVVVSLAPGLLWFNTTFETAQPNLTWSLVKGNTLVDRGMAQKVGNATYAVGTSRVLAGGPHTFQLHADDLLVAERTFSVGSPAWVATTGGTFGFRSERETATVQSRIVGTLRATDGGWRVDASGTYRDDRPNSSMQGRILALTLEPRDGHAAVTRVALELDMRAVGRDLGTRTIERTILRDGFAPDFSGRVHEATLVRIWIRLNGTLPAASGDTPIREESVTHQWIDRTTGAPLGFERRTWNNVTATSQTRNETGNGDETPAVVLLPRGPTPVPIRVGDAFVLEAGRASVRFAVGPGPVATVTSPFQSGTLTLDAAGRLLRYEDAIDAGSFTGKTVVVPPRSSNDNP